MNIKKTVSFLSLFFVLVFILWLNGCEPAPKGCGDSIMGQVVRPYAELRSGLEYRTGKSLEGWTYAELIALEEELLKLEEERKKAENEAYWKKLREDANAEREQRQKEQEDGEAKKEEVSAYYVDDEEDHVSTEPENNKQQEMEKENDQNESHALVGHWKGILYGDGLMKVYVTQNGERSEGFVGVEGGPIEFLVEVSDNNEAVAYASGPEASGEQGILYYDPQTKKVSFSWETIYPGSQEMLFYHFEGIVSEEGLALSMSGNCTVGIYAGEGNSAILQWEASLTN